MTSTGTVLNILRVGRLRTVRQNGTGPSCFVEFMDRAPGHTREPVDIPQPLGVAGSGVFIQPPDGAMVLVGKGYMNRFYVVSYLGNPLGERALSGPALTSTFATSDTQSTSIVPGEVLIRSKSSAYTKYTVTGDIINSFGAFSDITLSKDDAIGIYAQNSYSSYSSGYEVSGEIKREKRPKQYLISQDRLSDPAFDETLKTIGRNPYLDISLVTQELGARRNPPLVERRSVVYEFSRESAANPPGLEKTLYDEAASTVGIKSIKTQRQGSRTDAFGLSPLQHNILCETIIGTAADVYGNLLDINRKTIDASEFSDRDDPVGGQYAALRRSIKLHVELNSRKESETPESFKLDGSSAPFPDGRKIAADHSRWSIDVDGEGQTKINIPASSPTGNIPVHSRYVSASYLAESALINAQDGSTDKTGYLRQGAYSSVPNSRRSDTVHINYVQTSKTRGYEISGPAIPEAINEKAFRWTMPYHDPAFRDILNGDVQLGAQPGWYVGGVFQNQVKYFDIFGGSVLSEALLTNTKDYPSPGASPNAGGRSLFLNADGSLELAVGMDQVDNKSVVFDSAGSMIARFGRDKKNNSIMIAADGSATVVVGASRRAGDSDDPPDSKLKILVGSGNSVATIEVIDGHIHVRSAADKNIILEASKNLILSAGKQVLIHGEKIGVYGQYTEMGEQVYRERPVARSGEEI